MANKNAPYQREKIPASRLEIDMLSYQLKEARDQLETVKETLAIREERLELMAKNYAEEKDLYDKAIQRYSNLQKTSIVLSKRVALWRMVALAEAAAIVTYALIQLVNLI